MPVVTVVCDRCGRTVQGWRGEFATGGFYEVSQMAWSKYARPGESNVCAVCMFADPGYLADYAPIWIKD